MAKGEVVDDVVLEYFEGEPVVSVVVTIVKTGDGLSEPMQFLPQLHKRGERVTLVLTGVVEEIHHRPMKKLTGRLQRVERIVADGGGFVDNGLAAGTLNDQAERIATVKAQRQDPGADPLGLFRDEGDGPVPPPSAEEQALEAEEAAEDAVGPTDEVWETDPPPKANLRAVPEPEAMPASRARKASRPRKTAAKTTTKP